MSEPAPRSRLREVPWVWLGVVVLMVAAVGRQVLTPARVSPLVGTPVPELSLPLAEPSGDRVRLSDLQGQVVLLEFWATWCGACRKSTPGINALNERYAERGLHVLGVNIDADDPASAAAGLRAFGAQYPSVLDREQQAQIAFDIEVLPTLVLIDRQGVVRRLQPGFSDERTWAGYIREVL